VVEEEDEEARQQEAICGGARANELSLTTPLAAGWPPTQPP
jgi:hypothetical protein